jgi:thiamine-phosphate pyrophosphorylase
MTTHWRGLYAITDDALLAHRLLPAVQAALSGGCRWVQYRSKCTDAQQRHREAAQLVKLCRAHNASLLINDDVALAKTVGADGVHLGQDDMSLTEARRVLGSHAIIGITCHNSLALAQTAQQDGANYVAFGRFFSSSTKQSAPPADLSVLRAAKAQLAIPVVAIGGITLDNAPSVLQEGADLLAVVGDLFSAQNITARAQAYAALFT